MRIVRRLNAHHDARIGVALIARVLAHAIGHHAARLGRGGHHRAAGAHAKAVHRAPIPRVVHQLVVGRAQGWVACMATPACPVNQTLRVLNAKADGKGLGLHRHTAIKQGGKGIARAVAQGQHHVRGGEFIGSAAVLVQHSQAAQLFGGVRVVGCRGAWLVQCHIHHALLKANLPAQRDDLRAHGLHHLHQLEGADVRVRLIQNFFRCARQNKLVHHLATQVAWVFDLAVELAVRERARTAFTKLHIGLGLQQVLAPQAPGVLRALTHRLTALQHDGLEAHLRQDQCRKNATGAKAHDHGAMLHLRGCGGHRVVGHVGAGADVGVACKLGEQVGFPCGGYIHVNDIDPKQCRFACVKTALEYREVCDVSRRDAQGLGDQRRQGLGRVVQREFEFGQANHG